MVGCTMAIIITAVAVLLIHMLNKAVASIKPNIIPRASVPVSLIMFKAMRLCRFHFSMAMAMIKPPINKNMGELP